MARSCSSPTTGTSWTASRTRRSRCATASSPATRAATAPGGSVASASRPSRFVPCSRLPLQNYRNGAVVDERHAHHRPEGAGLHRDDARRAQPLAEVVEKRLGLLRRGRADEARALAFLRVGEEGELRDGEDLTPDILHAQVHLSLFVVEDPQACQLLREPVRLGLPVAHGDPDEEQEAGSHLGDYLVFNRDGGALDPLEDYSQS